MPANSITGTDGAIPIELESNLWHQWSLDQVYLGTVAAGRYVPKVKDYVIDVDTDERFRVTAINPTTLVPTLVAIKPVLTSGITDDDVLLGPVGGQNETYRVYIDKNVIPHVLSVDARLRCGGNPATAKLFKGNPLDGTAECVSAYFDQTGVVLTQAIDMELAETRVQDGVNVNMHVIPPCFTTENLLDGDELFAVVYNDAGFVVSKCRLLVEVTSFIRSPNAAVKYIQGISLVSPFLSSSDDHLIKFPLNIPMNGLNLTGIVHYSDGSSITLPVDGTKFRLDGFNNYINTVVGIEVPLVLTYNLSNSEIVFGAENINGVRHISENYRAQSINSDGSFSPKLFGYPVWINGTSGYRLEWFMYNLDRNAAYLVTPYVTINANTPAFSPMQYGVKQSLSVSIDLSDVNGTFDDYIHVQTIDITLQSQGTERVSNWSVGFTSSQNPVFGLNNHADTTFVNVNTTKVKIDMGVSTLNAWLDRVFHRTIPLIDLEREVEVPTPNMFALLIGDHEVEYDIDMWDNEMTIARAIPNNSTIFVKFFKRTADNDIQLAVAGLPVWQQN